MKDEEKAGVLSKQTQSFTEEPKENVPKVVMKNVEVPMQTLLF